jgi:hypothetical protein
MADKEPIKATRPPSLVDKVWESINRDGHLAAFARQGADELAVALKAFPESISVDEPGTLWNPTQGEIAADRKPPSPSEVAKDKSPYVPEHSQDHGHGMER